MSTTVSKIWQLLASEETLSKPGSKISHKEDKCVKDSLILEKNNTNNTLSMKNNYKHRMMNYFLGEWRVLVVPLPYARFLS